ncbi:MAG: hypothetical protein EBV51_07465 [Acidimicrobiia bacterium]|nr:hypothetical protein [Acidimicrobiia bacterium]
MLVSQEESLRTISRGNYFAIKSILPEVSKPTPLSKSDFDELSSEHFLMTSKEVGEFLNKNLSGDLTGH